MLTERKTQDVAELDICGDHSPGLAHCVSEDLSVRSAT